MEISSTHPFSKAFDHASNHIGLRFQNPLYKITELFTGSAFRSSLEEVKRFGRDIVRNARKRRAKAAFESLITQSDPEQSQSASSGGENSRFGTLIDSLIESFANPTIVADAALNFLSAGRDTTAQSLTWTLYALLRNSETLPTLRKEIDPIFSRPEERKNDNPKANGNGNDKGPAITMTNLQPLSLPYTLATFHESLRLYPPVPIEIKQALRPVTLPDGTSLPTDAIVIWCIWSLNRSETTFGGDAASFRPERWIDEHGKLLRRSEAEYPVFNGGPRACLGRKMAEVLACWVLGTVLVEFEFEEQKDQHGESSERVSANSLTLPMEGGLPCRVSLRQR
jgi:cytochrome P450